MNIFRPEEVEYAIRYKNLEMGGYLSFPSCNSSPNPRNYLPRPNNSTSRSRPKSPETHTHHPVVRSCISRPPPYIPQGSQPRSPLRLPLLCHIPIIKNIPPRNRTHSPDPSIPYSRRRLMQSVCKEHGMTFGRI